MIKLSVFYPNEEINIFDMDSCLNSHIPMIQEKVGDILKGGAVDQDLGGATPDSPATYVAIGHLLFDSVEAFQSSFWPPAEAIMADIPNYTDIQPTIEAYPAASCSPADGGIHREEFYLFFDSLANPAVPPLIGGTGNALTIAVQIS